MHTGAWIKIAVYIWFSLKILKYSWANTNLGAKSGFLVGKAEYKFSQRWIRLSERQGQKKKSTLPRQFQTLVSIRIVLHYCISVINAHREGCLTIQELIQRQTNSLTWMAACMVLNHIFSTGRAPLKARHYIFSNLEAPIIVLNHI